VLVARPGIAKIIEDRGLEGAIECVDEVTGRDKSEESARSDGERST
jgi:hypothetical protein